MACLKNILKILVDKVQEMIDNDECEHITEEDLDIISTLISGPKTMGRECAAEYLGISLNEFHQYRRDGVITEPRKVVGFKELHYYTCDLNKSKKIIDSQRHNTH